MWKVYILHDPRTNKPFYVGKGKKYRISATINYKQTNNALKKKFLEEIKDAGLEPLVEIVAEYEDEKDAFDHEKRLVAEFGRIIKGDGILTNYSEGGDSSNSGWIPSDKTRELWSSQRAGIKQNSDHVAKRVAKNTGQTRSDEQRKNLKLASIRRTNPELKVKIIKEVENLEYSRGVYQKLAKKFGCFYGLISSIHNNIDLYKEALSDWIEK